MLSSLTVRAVLTPTTKGSKRRNGVLKSRKNECVLIMKMFRYKGTRRGDVHLLAPFKGELIKLPSPIECERNLPNIGTHEGKLRRSLDVFSSLAKSQMTSPPSGPNTPEMEIPERLKNFQVKESPPTLSTFHLFTKLPIELRLKIYNLAIKPRIFHFNHTAAKRSKLRTDDFIPPLLHVCQESRTELIKHYESVAINNRSILVNQNLDTLVWIRYNGPLTFRGDCARLIYTDIPKFRHIAISTKFWNRLC
ncbi:hypothetical protein G7Y89_g4151 [Cudoniella acicularis]|uniref:2EXR domain-containing protein n=1 Tax=Cudoniella acicularis TaxID=354080 RepID=A0A8H4W6Z0_9HELO|nr:hypothetical protein G7Y89_g4151 [Cudoniella acicularis]